MNFKYYDLLSQLVPGVIVFSVGLYAFDVPHNQIDAVPALALAYCVGYLVNAVSSWFESFFYWTWGGSPSNRLLDGRGTKKVKFYESERAKTLLKVELKNDAASNDAMFKAALRLTASNEKSRVQDFNASFGFSRTILTAASVCSVFILWKRPFNFLELVGILSVVIILWQRSKDRAYYFAREVLNTYLNQKH